MKINTKSPIFLIAFGVILYVVLQNVNAVLNILKTLINFVLPLLVGLLIAFILNVPMHGINKRLKKLFANSKNKPSDKAIEALSLLLTIIGIILVLSVAFTMVIPALIDSVKTVTPLFKEKWPEWIAVLTEHEIDITNVTNMLNSLKLDDFTSNFWNLFNSAYNAASTTISGISTFVFGFIIAIYVLLSKHTLAYQMKKIIYANISEDKADYIVYVSRLANDIYAKFLSGQCMEAVILGVLIFLSFSLFNLPYAGLVGFLTAICAFIPYVGAFISLAVGVFLTLLVDPSKALTCLIVYIVVQFVENQFIYPRVVGSSVGLAPLWTLIAALVGGEMFGLLGIIFFIPLTATLYVLLKEDTDRKLKDKKNFNINKKTKTQNI